VRPAPRQPGGAAQRPRGRSGRHQPAHRGAGLVAGRRSPRRWSRQPCRLPSGTPLPHCHRLATPARVVPAAACPLCPDWPRRGCNAPAAGGSQQRSGTIISLSSCLARRTAARCCAPPGRTGSSAPPSQSACDRPCSSGWPRPSGRRPNASLRPQLWSRRSLPTTGRARYGARARSLKAMAATGW
jgi:hypothetical protein